MSKDETASVLERLGDVTKAIVTFSNSPEYRKLEAFYQRQSNFEILGIHRRETRHSRFLAWLLNPGSSHGLGIYALNKFIEVCVICLLESKQSNPPGVPRGVLDDLIVGSATIDSASVKTEMPLGKNGRIDILVEFNIVQSDKKRREVCIAIENKVDSKEHDSQSNRYSEYIKGYCKENDYYLLIYLTPLTTLKLTELEEPDCKCKEFLQINYQYLVDYMIQPCREILEDSPGRDFISDYLRALSVPRVIMDADQIKGDVIMAISEHERNLLTAFWEKHNSIILAALYAISNDPKQDKELRDGVEEALMAISQKNYDLYSISYEGNILASEVKKTRIGIEVARILIDKGISANEFSLLKSNRSSSFDLIKMADEITETEMKYNRYRIGSGETIFYEGIDYYVSGNWGENNIPKFNKFLKQYFPKIQLRKQNRRKDNV